MGEKKNVNRILVGKPEGKIPVGRPRRRWEDDIKMDLRRWINLVQHRDQKQALVNMEIHIRAL
jgi:hypothetical protein